MSTPKASRRSALSKTAIALASCLVFAACGSVGGSTTVVASQQQIASTYRLPELSLTPADKASQIAPSTPVTVTAAGGNITSVTLLEKGSATPTPGTLSPSKRSWTATMGLDPESAYTLTATAVGPGGAVTDSSSTFTTSGGYHLVTQVQPYDGETVGVGMPVTLTFNTPIPDELQAAVVHHISVVSDPPQQGAWHWFSQRELHWRPADFWQSGTHVTVTANLLGIDAGNGYYGYGNWTSSFVVGDKHVSIIDHNTEMMQVYTNDKLVNTIPVSLGKAGFPTLSGTLVVWFKAQKVLMDSCSTGFSCTPGSANYYHEWVYWDTAISTDGFFIHDAYWDIFAQGHYDYSHGCVNISPANATWFFNNAQVGDVVIIKNTARQADASDGEGDWQLSFDQYANTSGAAVTPAPARLGGGI